MKKTIVSLIIALIISTFQGASLAEDLNLSAESYILMDEVSGRVLVEHDSHKEMPMASTTKIMTALIAIENCDLDDIVKVDERSINIEGSSIYLKNKEKILMLDLLYGLMLRSGNDSAVAIANHICDTEEEFIEMMNKKARDIGAKNTNFADPHGLSDENHYSTAYDLALITREAFKYEIFEEIVASKSYMSKRGENEYFVNKNKTLWEYEDGDGVKIGYTSSSGRCLVSSAKRKEMRLIAVSLNAPNWFNDNYLLMDYGFDNYDSYIIYGKYQLMKKLQLPYDRELNMITEKELIYPLDEDERENLKVNISINEDIQLPIKEGEIVGRIDTYLDGVIIKKDNLISANDIKKASIIEKFLKFISKS